MLFLCASFTLEHNTYSQKGQDKDLYKNLSVHNTTKRRTRVDLHFPRPKTAISSSVAIPSVIITMGVKTTLNIARPRTMTRDGCSVVVTTPGSGFADTRILRTHQLKRLRRFDKDKEGCSEIERDLHRSQYTLRPSDDPPTEQGRRQGWR